MLEISYRNNGDKSKVNLNKKYFKNFVSFIAILTPELRVNKFSVLFSCGMDYQLPAYSSS